MTSSDPRFRDLDPRPDALPAAVTSSRAAFADAIERLLTVPDAALEAPWTWIGGGETDVRSGFYIALEHLERARGEVVAALAAADRRVGAAVWPLAANTEARWELHGVLAPLTDDALDADPGGGEWTVRKTLAHLLGSQRGYPVYTAWWLARRDEPTLPDRVPDEVASQLPPEDDESSGSLSQVRVRLDALVDLGTNAWQGATDADMAVPARWSGFPVTVGFRLGRPSAHLQEHTVQVDKTLAFLGRQPTEVERLVRLLHRTFGRVEGALWARPTDQLTGPIASALASALDDVGRISEELAALV